MSKTMKIEVIGPEPACARCKSVMENAEKAGARAKEKGIEVTVEKLNILSREVVKRYGVLVSPALAVNGVVKAMGRVPSKEEIERLLTQTK